jgi:uncharacterized protein (TIGR03905 family)
MMLQKEQEKSANQMKKIVYQTEGTCARFIEITGHNGCVQDVCFHGGCHGNLQGIARLVQGMPYEQVIQRLNGIRCGMKATSCPDQLCRAIEELMNQDGQ